MAGEWVEGEWVVGGWEVGECVVEWCVVGEWVVKGYDEGVWVLGEVSSSAAVAIETVVGCVTFVLVESVPLLLLS